MSSAALEVAGWVEGAAAALCCRSRALSCGNAEPWEGSGGDGIWDHILQMWDPLKCVHPKASLCLDLLLAAQRGLCVPAL